MNVTVAVPDPPGERVILVGDIEPVLVESVTVPAKPLRLVTVTENEQTLCLPPVTQVMLPGAVTLKSWTMNLTVAECDSDPETPVTVTV